MASNSSNSTSFARMAGIKSGKTMSSFTRSMRMSAVRKIDRGLAVMISSS